MNTNNRHISCSPHQTDTVGGEVISIFEFKLSVMADQYDVDDTGGWDATHEAAAAAAAAHAAGKFGLRLF